ncbi:MAG: PAS domain S-box protein [Chloroflexota bacterium]|nr:PAS domain S-box protein [Chloroflexota bacterium]
MADSADKPQAMGHEKRNLFSYPGPKAPYSYATMKEGDKASGQVGVLDHDDSLPLPQNLCTPSLLQGFQGIADSRGRLQFASEVPIERMGYTEEEILAKPFWEAEWFARSHKSQKRVQETLQQALLGESRQCHVEAFTKEGESIPVTFTLSSLKGTEGDIVSIVTDTTPPVGSILSPREVHRKADTHIEQRYWSLFNNPIQMVYVYDERGCFLDTNDCALERLGYSQEDLGNLFISDVVHSEDIQIVLDAIDHLITQGNIDPLEIRLTTKAGETIWIDFDSVLLERDEEHILAIGMARDITIQKEAQQELERKEQYYRSLIENSTDAITVLNADGTMRYQSPSYEKMMGYSRDDIANKNMIEIIHPDEIAYTAKIFAQLIQNPGSVIKIMLRAQHKNGSWRSIDATASNLLNDPEVNGIVCNFQDITDLKEAEENLRQSETQFRSLFETIPDIYFVIDPIYFTIIKINPVGVHIMGYESEEELYGTYIFDLLEDPQELIDLSAQVVGNVLSGGDTPIIECVAKIKKTGTILNIEIKFHFHYDESGKPLQINCLVRDISERKRAEEELVRTLNHLNAILDSAISFCIVSSDLSGNITSWNTGAELMIGYSKEEAVDNMSAYQMIDPLTSPPTFMQDLAKDVSETGSFKGEVKGLRKNGEIYDASINVNPLKDASNNIIGLLAIIQDITEQHRVQEDLRESEEQYRRLVDNLNDGYVIVAPSREILFANAKACSILGYQAKEIISLDYYTTIAPEMIEYATQIHQDFINHNVDYLQRELTILRKDGIEVPAEMSIGSLEYKGISAVSVIIRDCTDRKQVEEQREVLLKELAASNEKLCQSNSELQNFAYIASHDLREPLRKISAFGEILSSSISDKLDEDDLENLNYMIDGASRMQQMIDALLSYSRVTTTAKEFGEVDLNRVMKDITELEISMQLDETNGTIEIPEPLPRVNADKIQIYELLHNLVGNGLKYHRQNVAPRIIVRGMANDDRMVRLEVEDNGIGIAEEHHKEVFNMFRRLHSRGEYEGTGIGLAICKKIVERHGGEIGIKSSPDEGSTFWFTLPIEKPV